MGGAPVQMLEADTAYTPGSSGLVPLLAGPGLHQPGNELFPRPEAVLYCPAHGYPCWPSPLGVPQLLPGSAGAGHMGWGTPKSWSSHL